MNNYISGNVIRILRGRQKYTQKQLADRLGVSDKTISKWETGGVSGQGPRLYICLLQSAWIIPLPDLTGGGFS